MEETAGVCLNLGSGKTKWPGWVNVDLKNGDLQCDITQLELPSDHADQIAAIHVLEHFYQWDAPQVLTEWMRVLKPGGKLILELPCMDKVLAYIQACMNQGIQMSNALSWFVFWGDPKYQDPLMVHKWGYTKAALQEILESVGFKNVTFETPRYHFEIRDMRSVAWK